MKRHDAFLELAAAAIDFPLSPDERARLEQHLAECAACARSLAAFRADAVAVASTPVPVLAERRGAEILSAALHPATVRPLLRTALLVAILGLLVVGSLAAGSVLIRAIQRNPLLTVLPLPTESRPPDANASVAASPSAGPSAPGWQRSPDQAAFQDTGLKSVIWTGARFIATTTSGSAENELLDSNDGQAWHRQSAFATTAPTSGPTLVAAGPGGAVAFGGGGDGPLAAWQSADGLAWSAAPEQAAFRSSDAAFLSVHAVIASDDGWLAVGGEQYANAPTPGLLRGVVLTSADGIRWTRLPDQPALRYADMTAIARGASGYVAVGTVLADPARGDSGLRAAAWTSPDGRTWTAMGIPPAFVLPAASAGDGPTNVILHAIATEGNRLVALGEVARVDVSGSASTPPLALAWWSDGAGWTPVEIDRFAEDRKISIEAVSGGFLAIVGTGSSCASGIWASTDGGAWACIANDPVFAGFVVWGAAASPDVEVLVGHSRTDPVVAAAWTLSLR